MAPPTAHNIFLRLPPATAALLLSAVFALTQGHALPRQTKAVAFHELDVIPFPPAPTGGLLSPFGLQLRQESTICGYIGGNSDLPATCSRGSHCVLDAANSVVGCCPDGGTCTTGVFTGCVDRNSDPQTEINPYVYTCQGADVCYKNNFAGGYFQYGCGTASELGTTVQTSADGATTALSIGTVRVSLTESPSILSTPTTIGSSVSTSATTSSASSSSSSSSSSDSSSTSSATSTSSTSSTTSTKTPSHTHPTSFLPTPTPTEDPGSKTQSRTGAIIGGVVGGAAAVIALVALAFFCLRRRNRNRRVGPGPTPTAPPTTQYTGPIQSHGAAFAPLPSWHDEEGSFSQAAHNNSHPPPPIPYGPLEQTHPPAPATFYDHTDQYPPDVSAAAHTFAPLRYNPGYMPVGRQPPKGSLTPVAEEEQSLEREEPEGREIDDFSRAYSGARIGQLTDDNIDGDRTPLRDYHQDTTEDPDPSSPRSGNHRPLWQQNRQQRRNLMWL